MEKKKSLSFKLPAYILIAAAAALAALFLVKQEVTNAKRDIIAEQLSGRKWAEKIEMEGVPNFHKVSDNLYRGAQPTKQGIENLEQFGIKTFINLRTSDPDEEIADSNASYEQLDMKPWKPQDKEIIRFLRIVSNESNCPVFVHCRRGADRTGTMCAAYRIVVEGWTKQQAIEEMTKGGFGFSKAWKNLFTYIQNLDPNKFSKDLNL